MQDELHSAADFAVLAASTITSTGGTKIDGGLGVHPGTSITGFPPGIVTDGVHSADEASRIARHDAIRAYDVLSRRLATYDLTDKDLGGMILDPGVYKFNSSAGLTGKLVLDSGGDPDASFIFIIGSTLTTAEKSMVASVVVANVFWLIGSSATLGTGTDFVGNIIAMQSITCVTGSKVRGRLVALNGAVTLDSNHVHLK